jgi:hypothetical protein
VADAVEPLAYWPSRVIESSKRIKTSRSRAYWSTISVGERHWTATVHGGPILSTALRQVNSSRELVGLWATRESFVNFCASFELATAGCLTISSAGQIIPLRDRALCETSNRARTNSGSRRPSGVDPCGERGEFHTFTFDGPGFFSPIDVSFGEVFERDGFVFCDVLPV